MIANLSGLICSQTAKGNPVKTAINSASVVASFMAKNCPKVTSLHDAGT